LVALARLFVLPLLVLLLLIVLVLPVLTSVLLTHCPVPSRCGALLRTPPQPAEGGPCSFTIDFVTRCAMMYGHTQDHPGQRKALMSCEGEVPLRPGIRPGGRRLRRRNRRLPGYDIALAIVSIGSKNVCDSSGKR